MSTETIAQSTRRIRHVPGLPLLGNYPEHQRDRLALYLRAVEAYGDVVRIDFGPFPLILFNDAEYIRLILVEHAYDFDKGEYMHNAFRPSIGNGLFISEGDLHRHQRKLMAPSFQPRHIKEYADTMVQYSERIQQKWQEGATIDVAEEMTHITMSIIGKVLFDADVFSDADELGQAMIRVLEHTSHVLSNLYSPPLNWPTRHNRQTREAITLLRERMRQMIDERRSHAEERNDFLSILLRAKAEDGSSMSEEQAIDESLTLFGAGHETTATALAWTWYALTQHPNIYKHVLDEVDTVLQGRTPTYADLMNLPYCLQVFKETLRLYPPAYAVSRVALHDIDLNGYQVHRGETVMIPTYALHRRTDYYPNPEMFSPERFTPEREKQLPRYAYLPFGAGPRICIGNHFAMMEGHLLLATLAQRVTFELLPDQEIVPNPQKMITIRPVNGVKVRVHRRAQ